MAKRKKRNAITLILLLLALAALILVYYWYGKYSSSKEDKDTTSDTISLVEIDKDQVNSLHYKYDDADLTFVKEDDIWKSEAAPDRPINQDYVNNMLNAIDEISADRLIAEKPDNLEDYGLAEPISYLQAKLTNGSSVTLQVGNEVSTKDGYYALVNEDGKVYMLASNYVSGLRYNNVDMTAKEAAPTIKAESINHIVIDKRDGDDFELLYDDQGNYTDSCGSNLNQWYILKPYKLGYTADSTEVATLQKNYTSFTYLNCVDYDAEDLSKYGLADPMASIYLGYTEERTETLDTPEKDPDTGEDITKKTYEDPKEYTLYVGNLDDSGNYYVRVEGSNAVYTMDDDSIDNMLTVDTFSLLNTFVNLPFIDNVDRININAEGTDYTITMERTTQKNEDGKEETKTSYFFNGAEVEESTFKSFYQTIISAKFDTEIKEDVNIQDVTPILTFSYHMSDGTTIASSYYPYNDSFYIVKANGETRFYSDKRKIDDIITAIKELETK